MLFLLLFGYLSNFVWVKRPKYDWFRAKSLFFENWNCLIFFGTFKEIMFFLLKEHVLTNNKLSRYPNNRKMFFALKYQFYGTIQSAKMTFVGQKCKRFFFSSKFWGQIFWKKGSRIPISSKNQISISPILH